MANLTDNQIKALIYNGIGRASETSTVPFNRLLVSTGNSGYSIGALQTDFGQRPARGRELIDLYQSWAPATDKLTTDQVDRADATIVKRGLGNSAERLDPSVEAKLNKFLASSDGVAWMNGLDDQIYAGKVAAIVSPIQNSKAYSSLSDDDAAMIIGRIAKAYNQNQNVGIYLKDQFVDGNLTLGNFDAVFDRRLQTLSPVAQAALHSGQANATQGIELFNVLNDGSSDLANKWHQLVQNDPANLQGLTSDPGSKFFDALFRNPASAKPLVDKIENDSVGTGAQVAFPAGAGDTRVVGVDRNGGLFVVSKNGEGYYEKSDSWVPFELDNWKRISANNVAIRTAVGALAFDVYPAAQGAPTTIVTYSDRRDVTVPGHGTYTLTGSDSLTFSNGNTVVEIGFANGTRRIYDTTNGTSALFRPGSGGYIALADGRHVMIAADDRVTSPADIATRTRSTRVGLQLTVPLFSGGGTQSRVREATANLERSQADLETARRTAAAQARQAFTGVTTALAQGEALASAVESSRSALQANEVGYRTGTRINIDVLNAQQQLYAAQRDLAKARYEALMQSLKLKAAAGVLTAADLGAINTMLRTTVP